MKISSENKAEFLIKLLDIIFGIQKHLLPTVDINPPKEKSYIYALWHGHQCGLYKIINNFKTNILISRSIDGEIIAKAAEHLGLKSVRGSMGKKGSVEATMQLISRLKNDDCVAITVDGPRGPAFVVKKGIIKIAKHSGRPIIPYVWYSPDLSFIKLPTWDKFRYPLGYTRTINLYGEPIYVSPDGTPEDDELARVKVQESLNNLMKNADSEWKKAWKGKLWMKTK